MEARGSPAPDPVQDVILHLPSELLALVDASTTSEASTTKRKLDLYVRFSLYDTKPMLS